MTSTERMFSLAKDHRWDDVISEIEKGADPKAIDQDGWSILHHAVCDQLCFPEHVDRLLPLGADVHAECRGRANETALHIAAGTREPDIIEVLLKHGADINRRDFYGKTPLCWASASGDGLLVEALLEAGAKVNTEYGENCNEEGERGWTSLHFAARAGSKICVEWLIRAGADCDARTKDGYTPFLVAVQRDPNGDAAKVLARHSDVFAVTEHNGDALELAGPVEWLVTLMAEVNELEFKKSVMYAMDVAASEDSEDTMRDLLRHFDPTVDIADANPLDTAARVGNDAGIRILTPAYEAMGPRGIERVRKAVGMLEKMVRDGNVGRIGHVEGSI